MIPAGSRPRLLPAVLWHLAIGPLLAACAGDPRAPSRAAPPEIAPTGKLRVALNAGNPILATRDPATGELRGVSVDLARGLAAQSRLPVEFVTHE